MSICVGGPRVCGDKKKKANMSSSLGFAKAQDVAGATGFGGVVGYCSALFMKKAGRAAAITLGGVIAMFQVAAFSGYISVNWNKIERDMSGVLDLNKDGKLDSGDLSYAVEKSVKVLSHNMGASGAGFAGGFVMGLRK